MKEKGFYVVGIGASAGGYEALGEFFAHLSEQPNAAFVVIMHLLRDMKSIGHQLIAKHTQLQVYRATHLQKVEPNCIYIIPEGVLMTIEEGILQLRPRQEDEIINLAIDYFFESLAKDRKRKAVGIILTGTGSDGARGVQAISQLGGMVLVQDPASARFASMPKMAIQADHPDFILHPARLAEALSIVINGPGITSTEGSKTTARAGSN